MYQEGQFESENRVVLTLSPPRQTLALSPKKEKKTENLELSIFPFKCLYFPFCTLHLNYVLDWGYLSYETSCKEIIIKM